MASQRVRRRRFNNWIDRELGYRTFGEQLKLEKELRELKKELRELPIKDERKPRKAKPAQPVAEGDPLDWF